MRIKYQSFLRNKNEFWWSQKIKLFKNFLPFGALIVGAFVGLAQFRKLNYQYKRNDAIVYKEQLDKIGVDENDYQSRTTESLQKEYEKVMDKMDLNNWENIRGPRPWENSKEMQDQMRKKNEFKMNK